MLDVITLFVPYNTQLFFCEDSLNKLGRKEEISVETRSVMSRLLTAIHTGPWLQRQRGWPPTLPGMLGMGSSWSRGSSEMTGEGVLTTLGAPGCGPEPGTQVS